MRCGVTPDMVPMGNACKTNGTFRAGCIYEVAWESLALPDAGTDATLKHVPRSGLQLVLGFIVDLAQPVYAATGPGVGPLTGVAAYMTALTVDGDSYMPKHSSSSGAAVTSNKYALAAFAREVQQRAGGAMASLESGEGTPWGQFGVHRIVLGTQDDVTVTIENQTGLAADFGGTFVILQLSEGEKMNGAPVTSGSALPSP